MTRAVVLARHPEGAVTEQDFKVVEMPVGDCPAGYFRTRNRVISLDAGFRQWMTAGAGDNYLTGMQVGDPVQSIVLGEVIESHHARLSSGNICQRPHSVGGVQFAGWLRSLLSINRRRGYSAASVHGDLRPNGHDRLGRFVRDWTTQAG